MDRFDDVAETVTRILYVFIPLMFISFVVVWDSDLFSFLSNYYFDIIIAILTATITIFTLVFTLSQFILQSISSNINLKVLSEFEKSNELVGFYLINITLIIACLISLFLPPQLHKLVVIIILLFIFSLILLTSLTRLMFNYSNPISYSNIIMKKIDANVINEISRKPSQKYYFPRKNLILLFSYITDIIIKLTLKYEISAAIEILNKFYKLIKSPKYNPEMKNLLFRTIMGEYLRIIKSSIKSEDTYRINEEIIIRTRNLIEYSQSDFEAIENFFGLEVYSSYYYKFMEVLLEKNQVELFKEINRVFPNLDYINIFNTKKLDLFFIRNMLEVSEDIMSHENINFFK
ncbi:MAG: hypothetical protein LBM96_00510, partial [Methanobrevibacter sp.]|nr:hypothetical protein [Candidatus Methanoflexus mossambicus]